MLNLFLYPCIICVNNRTKKLTNFLHGESFATKESSSSVCFLFRSLGLRRFFGTSKSEEQFLQLHWSFSLPANS